jgi:16S rRNA (guanine527-N7)-methyltransferase
MSDLLERGLLKIREGFDSQVAAFESSHSLFFPSKPGLPDTGFPTDALDRLRRYIDQIELFNPAYGLVGSKDRNELVIKHILDSLAPLALIRLLLAGLAQGNGTQADTAGTDTGAIIGTALPTIADLGSGAGLPGIPLAICLPEYHFTLIERMGRRIGFLENTCALLGLKNIGIEQSDVERAQAHRFSLIVFRAFRPLEPAMLKAIFRLLAPNGLLAAYKAREERVAEELGAVAALVGAWKEIETPVPFLEEQRRLVIVRPPA